MSRSKAIQTIVDDLLTVQDIAKKERVSVLTVHNWREKGLPAIVVRGTNRPVIRFHKQESRQWIRQYRKNKA